MEYLYVRLESHHFEAWDTDYKCWRATEDLATRFTLDERIVIEKYGLLTGGQFVKVRT